MTRQIPHQQEHLIAQKYRRPSNEVLVRVPFSAQADLMKPIIRKASVRWIGGARDDSGAITTESGVLKQIRYFSDTAIKKTVHLRFRRNANGSIKLEMETLPLQSFDENTFEVRVALKPKVAATRNFNVS